MNAMLSTRRLALLAAALWGIAFAAVPVLAANDLNIKIDNFTFAPDKIEVPVGSTVVWTNNDDIPHEVAADDLKFRSHALDTGDSYSYIFTKPGTYGYFCSLHPHMKGTIVVR